MPIVDRRTVPWINPREQDPTTMTMEEAEEQKMTVICATRVV
jgi:hypothetical protein